MKLGRRFIGADINLGAIQTTTKRLISIAEKLDSEQQKIGENPTYYTGFEVYNVNNYDFSVTLLRLVSLLSKHLTFRNLKTQTSMTENLMAEW